MEARRTMAEPDSKKINLARQAKLLSISRTSLYRKQDHAWYEKDLLDMRLIDEVYTAKPFYGYRRITEDMRNAGRAINRKRVRRLMRIMDVHGICPGPNLSKLLHAKYVRPYLLRGLKISHPDQVWAVDITFIRMRQGFMYLFVVIDLFSRYIVDYELSMTLDRQAFLGCLKRAFKQAKPEYSAPHCQDRYRKKIS